MLIDDLGKLLQVPVEPLESGRGANWGSVTDNFGESLPVDYMQFIDRYGTGIVNDFLTVLNPFSANRNLNLLNQAFVQLSALRALKNEFPEQYSYPLFFEPGGVLPWGMSIDSDLFCWRTEGASGRWSVVVFPRHGDVEAYPMPMCAFILGAMQGSIASAALPKPFVGGNGVAEFKRMHSAL